MSDPTPLPPTGPAAEPAAAAPEPRPLGGRLHPAVLLIWPSSQLLPIAFLVVAGGWNAVASGAIAAVAIIGAVVRWWRFTWRVEGRTVVIDQGLFARRRRVLPFERIQSVDLVAPLRHRLLRVVQVRLEAVGGSETEGALDAVGVAEAERLRATVLAARAGATAPGGAAPDAADAIGGIGRDGAGRAASDRAAPAGDGTGGTARRDAAAPAPLVRMRPGRLVQAGMTGGRVGVAAALFGAAEQLFGDRLGDVAQRLPGLLAPRGFLLVAAAALVGGFLLSVGATVVAYWDFTLTRVGDELRIRRGLLEQRQATIPLRRVQSIRVEENLVRRALGLAAVKADVAGSAGGDGARDTGVLLPLGSRRDAHDLVAALLDDPALADVVLSPMPPRARARRLARAAVATVLITVPAAVLAWPRGAAAVLVAVPAVLLALAAYRALGRGETDAHVVTRSGVLVRRTAAVGVRRIQSLQLRASPSQRRLRLATVDLQIARSPGVWGGPRLQDVDRADGEALVRRLAARLTARPSTAPHQESTPPSHPGRMLAP